MLLHRLLMSAILIPTTIFLFVWDNQIGGHSQVFITLVLLLATRCVWELVTLARAANLLVGYAIPMTGTWGIILWGWRRNVDSATGTDFFALEKIGHGVVFLGVVGVALLVNAVFRFPRSSPTLIGETQDNDRLNFGHEIGTLGVEFMIVVYIGVMLALAAQLRWHHSGGYFALGAMVIAAKTGDVGAYTFGRLIGGPKMCPKLSPGKTWAGGVGHLLTAGLCTSVWLCWLGPLISPSWRSAPFAKAITFGVVVGFAGLLGDLAESLIKRDVGVKDAPVLLPGFGGLLDLMDSLLMAGPVAYVMWMCLRPWY